MYYSVLTPVGVAPFKRAEKPPVAPGDPLRVSEEAVLIEFEIQPTQMFSQRMAPTYSKILWNTNQVQLHEADLAKRIIIETVQEFQELLRDFVL